MTLLGASNGRSRDSAQLAKYLVDAYLAVGRGKPVGTRGPVAVMVGLEVGITALQRVLASEKEHLPQVVATEVEDAAAPAR